MEIHRRLRPSSNNSDEHASGTHQTPQIRVAEIVHHFPSSIESKRSNYQSISVMLGIILLWLFYLIALSKYSTQSIASSSFSDVTSIVPFGNHRSARTEAAGVSSLRSQVQKQILNYSTEQQPMQHLIQSINKSSAELESVSDSITSAILQINHVRNQFYKRYGGKEEALTILKRTLRTFEKIPSNLDPSEKNFKKQQQEQQQRQMHNFTPSKEYSFGMESLRATALRFLNLKVTHDQIQDHRHTHHQTTQQHEASYQDRLDANKSNPLQFVMSFAGYSVTVGRGNHFSQSFPFVLERILAPILKLPPLNIELVVRNSAIGGIPSFPYGWCLENFLGRDTHAISWDYAMNEGNGATGLESYLRHSLVMPYNSPPLFILLDTKSRPRMELLQSYVNMGYLTEAIALGGGKEAINKELWDLPEAKRPEGLQLWDEWGAPPGSPGQSPWHPKKKEHELMGWVLAMYMLEAVEVAFDIMLSDAKTWKTMEPLEQENNSRGLIKLPPPITTTATSLKSILYGTPCNTDLSKWYMNRISCRTSFLPAIHGHLESIIVSGITTDEEDMLKTRDDSLFVGGWVMDIGKVERETKLKVKQYGGLGYIDMKTALYGIPSSGVLKFWLPFEDSKISSGVSKEANMYFNAVILCEVNEKRGGKECNMMLDLSFRIGGIEVSRDSFTRINGVASYLKKDICIQLDIPKEANVSFREESSMQFGLDVEVEVTGSRVSRENGACSISHVIWEHR